MKYIIILFIILNYNAIGQNNLIRNGGFENGTRLHQRINTEPGDISNSNQPLNGCDYWSIATYSPDDCGSFFGGNGCTTADWWDPSITIPGSIAISTGSPPINTNKCAGMILSKSSSSGNQIEGVRTSLTNNLVSGRYYKLKLRMSIGNQNNPYYSNIGKESGIVIHFAKYSTYWNANTSLSSNVKWFNAIKFKIPANSQHQWYSFEEYFRVPEEVDGGSGNELANIVITQNEDFSDLTYLFIDDVELIEYDPCVNACKDPRLDDPLQVYCCGKRAIFPNTHHGIEGRPWNFKVENAMEIKISLIDRWGGIFYNKLEYNPNVLVDSYMEGGSSKYHQVFWEGKDDDGHLLPVSNTFVYKVSVKNCYETKDFTGTIELLSHLDEETLGILPTPIKVNKIKTCCPEFDEVKNETISSRTHKKSNSYLSIAGGNNVIINTTDLVNFTAGIEIELKDGFETMDSANFEAYCATCIESNSQKTSLLENKHSYSETILTNNINSPEEFIPTGLKNNITLNKFVSIYPNPLDNNNLNYKINSNFQGEIKFKVIDIYGCLKAEGQVVQSSGQIELNNLQSGIYILEFIGVENGINWTTKFSKL